MSLHQFYVSNLEACGSVLLADVVYVELFISIWQNIQLNDTFAETHNPIYDTILTKFPT
jgi:hypothetical protein